MLLNILNVMHTPAPVHTMDALAATRWIRLCAHQSMARGASPWLHEEIARTMAQRLADIKLPRTRVAHWQPLIGGLQAQAALDAVCPGAAFWLVHEEGLGAHDVRDVRRVFKEPLLRRWLKPRLHALAPAPSSMDMVFSNMALHSTPDPKALMQRWLSALKVGGFVMLSTLGPQTLMELRQAYKAKGWHAPACHAYTDMHDWGDRLLSCGFSEPIVDMQCLSLTFETPERALAELRELGRNLSPTRDRTTRARHWKRELIEVLEGCRNAQGQIALTFEVVYGHAIKPAPRAAVKSLSSIPLEHLRQMLKER